MEWYSESYNNGPDVPSDRLVRFLAASPSLQVSRLQPARPDTI